MAQDDDYVQPKLFSDENVAILLAVGSILIIISIAVFFVFSITSQEHVNETENETFNFSEEFESSNCLIFNSTDNTTKPCREVLA